MVYLNWFRFWLSSSCHPSYSDPFNFFFWSFRPLFKSMSPLHPLLNYHARGEPRGSLDMVPSATDWYGGPRETVDTVDWTVGLSNKTLKWPVVTQRVTSPTVGKHTLHAPPWWFNVRCVRSVACDPFTRFFSRRLLSHIMLGPPSNISVWVWLCWLLNFGFSVPGSQI